MSMEKRVFVASLATETNTFSPLRTDLQDFKDSFYAPPGEHPETPTLCSAVFPVAHAMAEQYNWKVIDGTASWAEPGGIVNQQCWEFLRDQLLDELKAAMPVDIVLLGLHGAMVAQECLDCEGELLQAVRNITGPNITIAATLDPHSHLSAMRLSNADLLIAFKEFPHTDFNTTAERLCALAYQTALGEVTPVMTAFDCRMIEVLPTSREPMRGFVDKMKSLEGQDDILSLSTIHGFMAGDVPDMGTKILVISDNNTHKGDALAKQLGTELFSFRGTTRPEFLTATAAIMRAASIQCRPVVVADVWDNPGGGVAGDSTILIREAIKLSVSNIAFATIWDPVAVRTCFSAGLNAKLTLRFGGKMSDQAGEPVDAEVIVRSLVREATQSFGDSVVPLGDSVWIEIQGIHVILNSVRSQVFDPDLYINMGIDPTTMDILVVKSTNHFHDAFALISDNILYAAVEGLYPSNPETNHYTHLKRDIWPIVSQPHTELLENDT